MEIYDSEEEQVAALKRWWKANGKSILIGVIVGILVIVGWKYWKSNQQDQILAASALYEELLKADASKKTESVQKISAELAEKYASTPYATYAGLFQAKNSVQKGDLESAKKILENVMNRADAELRNVARIRLIRLNLATGKYEQGLQLIAEVDPSSTQGFTADYDELTGDLYVALERYGEARTAYQKALRQEGSSPLIQFKLDDINAPEIIEK